MRLVWILVAATSLAVPGEDSQPPLKALGAEDAKRVEGIEKEIEELLGAGKLSEALPLGKEIESIRVQAQGRDHWETVDAVWRAKTLTAVLARSPEDQAEYQAGRTGEREAQKLDAQGKYAEAQPFHEKALAIKRKLLGEEHPDTAAGYNNLALNLYYQGKYAEAQPLCEKALAILKKLLGEEHPHTATGYNNVGGNLNAQGKYAEAQPLYEKALALRKKVLGEEHPDVAMGYSNLAANLNAQGKYAEAQPLLEKALAIAKKLLGEEHPDTAMGYNNLAVNLHSQGKNAEAQPLCEKALALRKKLLGEDHPDTAMGYNNLAGNLHSQGKYAEAQPLLEKALAIAKKLFGEDHLDTARGYNSLAVNLHSQGKYSEAEPLFEKALAIAKKLLGEDHPHTAMGYNNLAGNLESQGKYSEAQSLYEKALALRKKLLGEDHPDTARGYNDLAVNLDSQGKYAEAQPLSEKALVLRKKLLGEDHPDTAIGYNNLALNLNSQGKYAEAQPLFEKALAIKKKLLGEEHPNTARGYNNLAGSLNSQGKYAEAQPLYEKALALRKKLLGEEHPDTAMGYNNLAGNLNAQGNFAEAQPLYEKALALRKKLLGEDHPDTVFSCNNLALNLASQGKHKEALEEWLLAARSFEAARLRVSTSGLGRAEFGLEMNPLPALAAALADEGRDREAWSSLERGLGRGLFDDLSARQARKLTPEDQKLERRLLGEIERLDSQLFASAEGARKVQATDLERVRQKRLELQAELSAFEKHLSDTYGVAEGKTYPLERIQSTLRDDEALLGWLDVKLATSDHWAVVIRSKGDPRWMKLPGSGEDGKWTEDDMALGERLARELSDRRRIARPLDRARIEKLARLRLSPVEEVLSAGPTPARRLIVLPSSALRDVPVALFSDRFTVSYAPSGSVLAWIREKKGENQGTQGARSLLALGDPDFGKQGTKDPGKEAPTPPDHGAYVSMVLRGSNAEGSGIREGDVLLAYGGERLGSPKDLAPAMGQAKEGEGIQVSLWREGEKLAVKVSPGKLGVRLDERAAGEVVKAEREYAMLMRGLRGGTEVHEPLPGTREEVEAIGRKFKGAAVEKLLGAEASEQRLGELLDSGKLKGYRYIHFATHGVPSRERAFDSALILSKKEEGVDGRVTAGEILRRWSLQAELVVLSACQTAVGRPAGGEGYLGFAQALLLSGAEAVVLSLWKVDDTATSLLMERFYENLLAERPGLKAMGKADALREAQIWLRDLKREEAEELTRRQKSLLRDGERGTVRPLEPSQASPAAREIAAGGDHPYADAYFWAAFILIGDPE